NSDLEAATSSAQDKSSEELDKARAYRDSGEIDDAERWFRRGLADLPSDLSGPERGAILNEFAAFLIKYRRADRERAGEALKLSLQSNRLLGELFPKPLDVLAECQAVNGDLAAAVEAEKKALKVVESETDAAYLTRRLRAFEAKLKEQKK